MVKWLNLTKKGSVGLQRFGMIARFNYLFIRLLRARIRLPNIFEYGLAQKGWNFLALHFGKERLSFYTAHRTL